jgi:hypothetical protein
VFASRLAWATGYYVQPSYFVRSGVIRGARKLGRARWFIAKDGRFKSASFKLIQPGPAYVAGRGWEWDDNPFIGTRQLAGLKVLMMLTSNWDAKDGRKDTNTAVLRAGSSTYYVVDDWGASMGRWGNFFTREKWDCDEYAEQSSSFVRVESGCLRFGYSGKNEDDLTAGIRSTDVRWIAGLLARIEDAQLRDALRASGASPHEVRCFARAVRARIDRLRRVSRA